MEALQLLVDMVKELPDMAIWVILAFFVYKTIIVGSIYGVIKHVATKIHDAVVAKKREVKTVEIRAEIAGLTINAHYGALISQLRRIAGVRTSLTTNYIHDRDVDWLREAIDEKLAKDQEQ